MDFGPSADAAAMQPIKEAKRHTNQRTSPNKKSKTKNRRITDSGAGGGAGRRGSNGPSCHHFELGARRSQSLVASQLC